MCVQATASDICHVAAKSTWQLRIGLLFPACRAVISMLCEEIILLSCLPYPLNLRCSSTAWVLPAQQEQRQRMPIQIKQRQLNKIIQNPGLAFWRQQKSEEWDWLNLIIIPRLNCIDADSVGLWAMDECGVAPICVVDNVFKFAKLLFKSK
jgi:hypothetical protein